MNRRGFLKFLGAATVGSTVAYSFPSIIVPKNIEKFPTIIDDWMLQDTPFESYLRGSQTIFELLDMELKAVMNAYEKKLNFDFFGTKVTFEEIQQHCGISS